MGTDMRGGLTALIIGALLAGPALGAPKAKARPAPVAAAPVKVEPLPDTPEITELRRAFHFAFPVYEMMRTRGEIFARAGAAGIDATNRLFPRLQLADASTREVTAPNNDTLYASAWLDLAGGPVLLDVPELPGRYHSAALMNLFTDNVAIVGTRTGAQGGKVLIAGPAWRGPTPEGAQLVRCNTNDCWLLIRVLVDGPADQPAAAEALGKFALTVPEGTSPPVPIKARAAALPDAATFLAVVNEALGRGPLPDSFAARAGTLAGQGIVPGGDGWTTLTAEQQALWRRSLPGLRAELKAGLATLGAEIDGWSYPGPGMGDFGDDDRGRAIVALGVLAALPRMEAIYLSARADKAGTPLTGKSAYTVRVPARLPVGGFWSVTMYQVESDGRLFLVDNPGRRFSVGNRTDGIRANRDGSLDIFVQPGKPSGERAVNWLPSPPGPFRLIFRAYLPQAEFLDGSFRLPPVETSEVIP